MKVAEIPLGEIEWIRLYIGGCKKTLAQVMAETGADYAINGGMWNPDGSACPLLKADGDMVSAAQGSAYGYGWDTGPDRSCPGRGSAWPGTARRWTP